MSLCTTRFVRKASRGWTQQRSGYVPIHPGKTCSYEYDFGSTTELLVKGIAEHEVEMKGKAIQMLAGIACHSLSATWVEIRYLFYTQGISEDKGCLRDTCEQNHIGSEEMLLPLVNFPFPRSG